MKKPEFPPFVSPAGPVWGQGNNLVSMHLLAHIPTYTLLPPGPERDESERLYWEKRQQEYDTMKAIYDKKIIVGAKWKGNTNISMRISKIAITEKEAYVRCLPSQETIDYCKERSKGFGGHIVKPPAPCKFDLFWFIRASQNGTVNFIN